MKRPIGFIASLCLAGATFAAVPAAAMQQAAAPTAAPVPASSLTPGTKIYDNDDVEIGQIAQVSGDKVAIAIGDNALVVPAKAFAKGKNGPSLPAPKAKIVAMVDQAAKQQTAALDAKLKVGAEVRSAGGSTVLGKVKAVSPDAAVMATSEGDVTLPRQAFFVSKTGLAAKMSAAQFAEGIKKMKAEAAKKGG